MPVAAGALAGGAGVATGAVEVTGVVGDVVDVSLDCVGVVTGPDGVVGEVVDVSPDCVGVATGAVEVTGGVADDVDVPFQLVVRKPLR